MSSKVNSLNAKLKRKSSFYVSNQVECKNKIKTESYDSSYQVAEYDCESSFGKEYFLQNTKTTINGNSRSQTHEFDCCRHVFREREAYVSS
uniref:Uncharacterized protein n=1 Tax=Romanomermis culicivorax TaxID=13658 RepID=A0A915L2I5_ROMCU